MRTCNFGILLLVLIMAAVGVSSSPVSADSCAAIIGFSIATANPPNTNIGLIVPVLAKCSFNSGQLYAIGAIHDWTANTTLSSVNTALATGYGISAYTGQLVFNLSPNAVGHTLQISVNIYNGQNNGQPGSSLATTSEIVPANANTNYVNFSGCYYTGACNTMYNYCQSPGINSLLYNNTVQCVGYLYQDPNANGCTELVIPVYSPYGFLSFQYYTLQNLPTSYPAIGTWVGVRGQLLKGNNVSPNGAACPGNYINVASIS